MKKIALLFSLSMFSIAGFCQTTPEEMVKAFFNMYPAKSDAAVDSLFATSTWSSKIKDEIETIKKDLKKYTPDYIGAYYGYVPMMRREYKESFMLLSYMVKYDREPLRFTFEFYKPNDKWIIYFFKIDTKIDDEIEDASTITKDSLQ